MLKIGAILQGRYRILRLLGSGGFGAVYQAEDLRLAGRSVAIKHFYTAHLSSQEAAEMAVLFQSEAHTLARLNHPNLAQIYDYFSEGKDWFLVMEFVPGETLLTRLKRLRAPFEESQVVAWAIELCRVLEYLHGQQPPLIFRDLKPANIMVTPDERVILIDFGIVRSFKEGQARDTYQIATPGYAPPEQYGGQTEPRSDLYSLGATVYTLLTGERPSAETFALPPLRERAPQVSPQLADLVTRLTAYEIADRPPSAAAVRQELEAIRSLHLAMQQPVFVAMPAIAPQIDTGRNPRTQNSTAARRSALPSRTTHSALAVLLALLLLLAGTGAALYASGLLTGILAGHSVPAENTSAVTGPDTVPDLFSSILISTTSLDQAADQVIDRDIGLLPLDGGAPQKLINGPTFDYLGSRRSDGMIVFTRSIMDTEEHICIANPDGSDVRQLTSGPTINRAGVWSPDGSTIAFESNRHSGSFTDRDVYLMDHDGGNIRRLTLAPGWQGGPAWSPDGSQIAYHTNENGRYGIAIVDVASGATRLLAGLPDANLYWPSWSPDGTTLAFMATPDGKPDAIYTIPAAGGTPVPLDLGHGSNRWPRWSPDGSQIAFESKRDGIYQVYLYSLKSGEVQRMSLGQSDDRWPGW